MRRRRKRQRPTPEARLQDDCRRALGFLEAVLADAQRLGVQPDEGVIACLVVLRAWSKRIITREEPGPPE
jgi:hypothetical protein